MTPTTTLQHPLAIANLNFLFDYCRSIFFNRKAILLLLLTVSAGLSHLNAQVTLTATSGTPTGSFTTLKAAFDAINNGTHQGNIGIRIHDNTTETATCVLDSSGNPSGSNYTSILIRPADTATVVKSVSTSAAIVLMKLNGADNITFDGRPGGIGTARLLEFNHTASASTNHTCRFDGGATNNIFRFCRLLNASAASTAHNIHLTNSGAVGLANSNNSFLNNIIQGGRNGIVIDGAATAANILIRNNQVINFGLAGISIINTEQFVIDSNSFFHEAAFTSTGQPRAINIGGVLATVKINATITKNRIFGFKSSSTSIYGMLITPPATATGSLYNINNNSIAFLDANNSVNGVAVGGVNGIAVTGVGSGEFNLFHNTIRIGGTAVGGTATTLSVRSVGIGKFNSGTANIFRMRNNIITNTRTGGASTQNAHMAVWIQTNTAGTHDIDNNTYQGTPLVAGWGGTTYATVTGAYQTAAGTNEANTNQKTPTFLNDTEPYLTGASNGDADLSATRIATVLTDIDNNTRAATCYKGAWESATPFAGPATVTVSGSLVGFTSCSGTPSAEQSFIVSGSDLTANIIVTPPTGFEVSTTSGSGFASSVTITQSGGTVTNTTIYTRLTASATGTPSGNITIESTGATTQNVVVSGTVNSSTTWNGTSWSNCTPTSTVDAIIASSTAPASFTCQNLTINSGVSLTTTGITATVNGNIINNGNGIAGTGGLTIAANSTISGSNINFNGTLTVNSGSVLTTGGLLTLTSNATNTARVAAGSASGGYISGNVKVERYIQGTYRKFRFLGHPFASAMNLTELTDDIDITGAISGSNANGFTSTTTSNPSAFTFNEANGSGALNDAGWTALTSGNSVSTIAQGQGIRILVRGTKGQTNSLNGGLYTPAAVTLNMTGNLRQGDFTQTLNFTSAAKGWNLVSNPYASNIDWTAVSRTNVDNAVYVYRPSTSAYASWINGSSTNGGSNIIEAGNAFFVKANAASPSLGWQEADKVATAQPATMFRTTNNITNRLSLTLKNETTQFEDEVVVRFGDDPATNGFDKAYDAENMIASAHDLYVLDKQQTKYSIYHGSALDDWQIENRSIGLGFTVSAIGTHSITAKILNALTNGNKAFIKDAITGTLTEIKDNTVYSFEVTTDVATQNTNRFSIVFNPKEKIAPTITDFSIKLSPNPAKGMVQLSYTQSEALNTTITITNAAGKQVQTISLGKVQYGIEKIDIGRLSKGIYFVHYSNGVETRTEKLIIE